MNTSNPTLPPSVFTNAGSVAVGDRMTLVWLYIEILRLLSKLRSRD
jgi:uncharacterized YccA/Bax inhibitor family protein